MLNNQSWINLFKYFLFFFYFSAIYQTFCFIFNVSGFVGLRESFYATFFWLIPIMMFPKKSKQISAVIAVFLWFASLPSLLYFMLYNQEFSQSVIYIIFESNIAEGSEFLNTYFVWWLIPTILVYSFIPYLIWKVLKPLNFTINSRIVVSILSLLIVTKTFTKLYLLEDKPFEKSYVKQEDKIQSASPWNLVVGYKRYTEVLDSMDNVLMANSKLTPLNNLQDKNLDEENTFVLVIGESTNRNRMSLYGYNRDTTPRLKALKNDLVVFNNVYSPRPYTIEVLQQDLTFADEQNPDLYLSKVNLLNIMKQAGYSTYWITNQQTQTQRNTMLTAFSKIADHQVYLNNNRRQNSASYDEVVFEPFQNILKDHSVKKKFIVVHLIGTHSRYDYRYPESFAKFDDFKVDRELNEKDTSSYNHYDNAIYYNDYVVSNLINSVKELNHNGALLYLSDHGEEVFDDNTIKKMGRNEVAPTSAMYTIPFIVYGNNTWQKNNNIEKFSSYTNRYYSASDLIYTFSNLAHISYDDLDLTKSILSDNFIERSVFIGDPYNKKGIRDILQNPFEKSNQNKVKG